VETERSEEAPPSQLRLAKSYINYERGYIYMFNNILNGVSSFRSFVWSNPFIYIPCFVLFCIPFVLGIVKFLKLAKKQNISFFKLVFSNKIGKKTNKKS